MGHCKLGQAMIKYYVVGDVVTCLDCACVVRRLFTHIYARLCCAFVLCVVCGISGNALKFTTKGQVTVSVRFHVVHASHGASAAGALSLGSSSPNIASSPLLSPQSDTDATATTSTTATTTAVAGSAAAQSQIQTQSNPSQHVIKINDNLSLHATPIDREDGGENHHIATGDAEMQTQTQIGADIGKHKSQIAGDGDGYAENGDDGSLDGVHAGAAAGASLLAAPSPASSHYKRYVVTIDVQDSGIGQSPLHSQHAHTRYTTHENITEANERNNSAHNCTALELRHNADSSVGCFVFDVLGIESSKFDRIFSRYVDSN